MPGSRESRSAWLALRGPFFASYVLLLLFILMTDIATPTGYVWQSLGVITSIALIVGAGASYAVVANWFSGSLAMRRLAILEVTALRLAFVLEFLHGIWSWVYLDMMVRGVVHLSISTLLLGLLSNMVWRKGATESATH